MFGRSGRIVTVIVLFGLTTMTPRYLWAQQSKGASSVDELLKSIGLSKPAMARAPDFNLRDANGGIGMCTTGLLPRERVKVTIKRGVHDGEP